MNSFNKLPQIYYGHFEYRIDIILECTDNKVSQKNAFQSVLSRNFYWDLKQLARASLFKGNKIVLALRRVRFFVEKRKMAHPLHLTRKNKRVVLLNS